MARMTDIDSLLEKVATIQASGGSQEKRVGEIIIAITNAPTVEIVRCKDCKHWHEETEHFVICSVLEGFMKRDDFCSYGERKDNA